MMSFPYLFFLCFRINWLPSDVRIRTHPAPVRQTWRTMGGYGIPDDANVHFLSPITAISICLETSQGKKTNKHMSFNMRTPLGLMDIRKRKKGQLWKWSAQLSLTTLCCCCTFKAGHSLFGSFFKKCLSKSHVSLFLLYYDVTLIKYYLKTFIFFWWLLFLWWIV